MSPVAIRTPKIQSVLRVEPLLRNPATDARAHSYAEGISSSTEPILR